MYTNPPERIDEVTRSLIDMFRVSGFESHVGALGGGVRTYGVVWREDEPLTAQDRDIVREWLKVQAMHCVVRLGELEELDDVDVRRDFFDVEFTVANLTEADRQLAAERRREISEKVKMLVQKQRLE